MTDSDPDHPEPRGCTLADLMALTLGAAIAASLYWYSTGADSNQIGLKPAPSWYRLGNQGIELIQKGCVALVPVILARRMRFGGSLRPVEYLPILTAIFQVSISVARWPVFGLFHRSPDPPHSRVANMEAYYVWQLSEFAVGALAALVVLIRRRRPPDWILGISLGVAWQLLRTWLGYFYQQWANDQLVKLPAYLYVALGSTFLVQWPQLVVAYLPMMIAILDLVRTRRGRWTWVVWAAVAMALPLPILGESLHLAWMALDPGNALFDAFQVSGKFLGLAASLALARGLEPAWRRFLYGSTANAGQTMRN